MKNEALQPPVRHTSPVHDCDVELFQNNSTHYALQTLMCRTPDDYIHRKYEKKAPRLRILRRKPKYCSPQSVPLPQKWRKNPSSYRGFGGAPTNFPPGYPPIAPRRRAQAPSPKNRPKRGEKVYPATLYHTLPAHANKRMGEDGKGTVLS